MNKLCQYIIFSLILGACTYSEFDPKTWSVAPELDINVQNVELKWNESEYTIHVTTNYKEFRVSTSCSWCTASADIDARIIKLNLAHNQTKEARKATVKISIERGDSYSSKEVYITQRGGESEVINNIDVYWKDGIKPETRQIVSAIIGNMVFIKGGDFYAGAQDTDPNGINYLEYESSYLFYDCIPVHKVTLSDYYICKYELTQKEWMSFMEENPSTFIGENLPVNEIEYKDAITLTDRLSEITNLVFDLPTEAQWEYAARGGNASLGYLFPGSSRLEDVAFVDYRLSDTDTKYSTYIGGQYLPNELGLYDMAGNVAELCKDYFGAYSDKWETDPQGPSDGVLRVKRGGAFNSYEHECTVYYRMTLFGDYGIRLVINNSKK